MKVLACLLLAAVLARSAESVPFVADSMRIVLGSFESPAAVWHPQKVVHPRLLVWFHGGMQGKKCDKGLEAGAALVPFLERLSRESAVLSVSACRENHWLSGAPLAAVDRMLDSLEARWKLKIDTVSLVGVSDGGLGVVGYTLYGKRSVRGRLLVSTNLAAVADAKNLAEDPRARTGTWMFLQGGSDRLYPSDRTVPWMERFCSALGGKVCRIRFDERGEHDWSWWTLRRESWIREFLR